MHPLSQARASGPDREDGASAAPLVLGAATRAAFDLARRAAGAELPVLVLGESGTGKELVARTVHAASPRRAAPLVVFDCAAVAPSLVEDQLFGHEAGAFTGAGGRRKGVFEEAQGGTVFLDEVGELPLAVQPKLLRVLEAKKVQRLGSSREVDVDVRIVAATNRDLDAMARDGRFRLDLLYRIGAFTMTLLPLRERPDEIVAFARHFLARAGRGVPLELSEEAAALLVRHAWPGNLRELKNEMERARVLAGDGAILPAHFSERVRAAAAGGSAERAAGAPAAAAGAGTAVHAAVPASLAELDVHRRRLEKDAVVRALAVAGGNQTTAARDLGMSRSTLLRRMKRFGL